MVKKKNKKGEKEKEK